MFSDLGPFPEYKFEQHDDLDIAKILPGFGVVAALGVVMLALNIRMIKHYD